MNARPAFDPAGMPEFAHARLIEKARASWCYVTADGRAFYVREDQARAMLACDPSGAIFPPEASA